MTVGGGMSRRLGEPGFERLALAGELGQSRLQLLQFAPQAALRRGFALGAAVAGLCRGAAGAPCCPRRRVPPSRLRPGRDCGRRAGRRPRRRPAPQSLRDARTSLAEPGGVVPEVAVELVPRRRRPAGTRRRRHAAASGRATMITAPAKSRSASSSDSRVSVEVVGRSSSSNRFGAARPGSRATAARALAAGEARHRLEHPVALLKPNWPRWSRFTCSLQRATSVRRGRSFQQRGAVLCRAGRPRAARRSRPRGRARRCACRRAARARRRSRASASTLPAPLRPRIPSRASGPRDSFTPPTTTRSP